MALATYTPTVVYQTPSANSYSFSHNHASGTDSHLFVVICMVADQSVSGVTYNGNAMTNIVAQNELARRQYIYKIAAPASGAHNVVISFSAGVWNPTSMVAFSATGSDGAGTPVVAAAAATPNSTTVTVSANSVIFALAVGNDSTSHAITLDGSSRTLIYDHNVNSVYGYGALSAVLTAGSKTVSVATTVFNNVAGFYFEIKEKASAGRRMRCIVIG